jgi:beta-N-acetylhexosaminidase
MDRTKARRTRVLRRRRLALAVLLGLALGAFAFGAALGDRRAPRVEVSQTLPAGQLAGERIVAGLEGTAISPRLRQAVRTGRIAGVVLFESSFPSRAAGARLIARLQAIPRPPALRDPLLVMVDQEGGLVKRIGGAPILSARQMGARGAAVSRAQGRRTAASLRRLGVNVDLAPVLDVGRPGGVIAATERSFGASAARVEASAIPFAEALQAGGVAATAKHFPGFGAAAENTDFAVEQIDLSKARLRAIDEAPFEAFVEAGGELVMLSTAIYPAFSERPAAFSRQLATAELRGRLGFEGVSVTDALGAVAVREFGGSAKASLAAAGAGVDLLLFNDLASAEAGHRALLTALRSGRLPRAEFRASAQRVLDLRAGF